MPSSQTKSRQRHCPDAMGLLLVKRRDFRLDTLLAAYAAAQDCPHLLYKRDVMFD